MNILVSISDMKVTDDVNAIIIAHSLGSCIGIAIYDPVAKAGGILHFMFPASSFSPGKAKKNPFMFADTGINSFLESLYDLGADRNRMKVFVAGGAEVIDQKDFVNIGKGNCIAAKKILKEKGIHVDYEDTGKNINRTIKLNIKTGELIITIPGREEKTICMK